MAAPQKLRTAEGPGLPATGTWEIDTAHSGVSFTVRHMVVGKTRGRFGTFSGAIEIREVPEQSSVAVSIDAASVDTRAADRDEHLRSPDFFDVANHPTLEFRSRSVEPSGVDWKVTGDLTIRGVTRPVVLDVEYIGAATDPWGNERAAFSASTEIDREAFGLLWNQALETGGVLVGKRAKVEIDVEAVRR